MNESPAHTPAPTVLAGLAAALRPHAPFAAMADADVDRLIRASRVRYFAPGEVILAPSDARPAHCYVIRKGSVRGERPGPANEAVAVSERSAGEMFPLGALLAHRGATSVYRAFEDTFCLEFPAAVFDTLVARSAAFGDFCNRQLAHLLDLSRAELQAEYAAGATAQFGMHTRLAELVRNVPVTVPPDASLRDALTTMEARRIGSLPVVDADGRARGIFTRQDVIGRVLLPQRDLATAIADVMSAPAITLPAAATAGDAALVMAQRGIRHIVITGGRGEVTGVVSERDLFSAQRLSARELSSALRRATDIPALVQCAADIRGLSHLLVAQGIASGPLTRMISALNDQLTMRVLDLTAPAFDLTGFTLCWLGMGSEGRSEQTIATDQDNSLIFAADDPALVEVAARDRVLPFAQAVNETLDRCGYPLCQGAVMAMNPQWCLSLPSWHGAFEQWIDRGDPESLLAASIFFDFRPLWGTAQLAQQLRDDIARRAAANPRFLKQMTASALRNEPPLSWRGEVKASADAAGAEGIDFKRVASMPLTDGARIYALASGVTATNTVERLRLAGPKRGMADEDIRSWCDAFDFLQMQRLRTQHRRAASEIAPSSNPNFVPLDALSTLDRRILTEALRQVRKLQQRLRMDYP